MIRFFTTVVFALMSSQSALAVTLIHSNDVLGEIEPCGCRNNPQGGLARKSNFLKKLQDTDLIQLDAGDLLFATDHVPGMLETQSEEQARFLLKGLDLLHHDLVVPGEKDFALGLKVFDKLRAKTSVKFIAANLTRKKGGKFLEPNAIFVKKQMDGKPLRIAVFGLVGDTLRWPQELHATSPLAAAKIQVKKLRQKADILIALTHQGLDLDKELAKKVPGIDIIIGGHSQSFLQKPIKEGSTYIYQSSFRNQYVGVIPLSVPLTDQGYQLASLDQTYDPAVPPMEQLVNDFKESIARVNAQQNVGTNSAQETAKYQTFARCAECHIKQFDFWRQTKHAQGFHSLLEKKQDKNKECLACHTLGFGDPSGFHDVGLLAEINTGTTPSPEDVDFYLSAMTRADNTNAEVKLTASSAKAIPLIQSLNSIKRIWTPVQCENCHSPGGGHPFSGTYSKIVEKTRCLNCHTAQRAPEWYSADKPDWAKIDAKRASITCPSGE